MKQKIKVEILDQLLADYRKPEDLIGPDGRFTELKKCLINRVLESELTTYRSTAKTPHHRHFPKGAHAPPAC